MEQIKIDIIPAGVAPVAHASQFDNGRQIRFNLFNQGTPYTLTGAETVTMVVNGEEENITNTSDNYVIWDVAEEDCEKVGVIGCEIRIVLGSMLIGSKNFFLEVEMDPYNGKNIRIVTVGPADICTFETTLPEPLQSVLVNVLATGGNGTPDNPNPINSYTEANITANGDTVTIAFGQTVYGGVLDVTRGKVTVTHGGVDLGSLNWNIYGGDKFYTTISDLKLPTTTAERATGMMCSIFKPSSGLSVGEMDNYSFLRFNQSENFWVRDTAYSDATTFKTDMNGVMLAYELATPFDIDLTPEVISAVVGTNNVFADCGETEVKYLKAEG